MRVVPSGRVYGGAYKADGGAGLANDSGDKVDALSIS